MERKDGGLEAGRLLPIDIEELQIEGSATVTAIESAPAIAGGEGSAVTGRFTTRRVDEICRIEVLCADGTIDTIEGTTIHPIWSVDRNDWVPLAELTEGEQLLASSCPATILTHRVFHHTAPVYNIEIHGEHVYQVGALGLLVHNAADDCLVVGTAGWRAAVTALQNASKGTKLNFTVRTASLETKLAAYRVASYVGI